MKSKLNKKKKSGEGRWGPGIDGLLAIEKLFLWGARAMNQKDRMVDWV